MIKVYALIFKGKTKWQIVRDGLGALRIYSSEEKAKEVASGYISGSVKVKEMELRFEDDR